MIYKIYNFVYFGGEIMYPSVEVGNVFRIKRIYTLFVKRYDSNYFFDGEYHNFWELVIVTDGKIGVTAGSDIFLLESGQAILHEPMEFHRLWSEGNTCPEIVIFSFSAENIPECSSRLFDIADINLPKRIFSELASVFEMNSVAAENIKEGKELECQIAIKRLEMFLLNTISQKQKNTNTVQTRTAKNYALIVNIMENNVDKNLSVADIAKMCNMSEINLKKTFSRYSGMGVKHYFNGLKITTAITMIKNGKLVQEIATALGFSNQNYFSTVFKRITGNPPTYYR